MLKYLDFDMINVLLFLISNEPKFEDIDEKVHYCFLFLSITSIFIYNN